MIKRILFIFLLLTAAFAYAQTTGLIIEPATGTGTAILDPNLDGYISEDATGFKVNDVDESEIPFNSMVGTDPVGDPLKGPSGSFNDIVGIDDDGNFAVMTYSDGVNLFFRFRLGGYAPNSKTYAILIDTDQKFGFTGPDADPNAVPGNPGFELEIALRTNFGVYVYSIDGAISAGTPTYSATGNANHQKSIALTRNDNNPDYFYDFFVPLSALGVADDTPLRFVATTAMSPNPAIGSNSLSDFGGVTEGSNFDQIFTDIIEEQTPTPPGEEVLERSACPTITGPISTSATTVSGTTPEGAGTVIRLYVDGLFVNSTTTSGNNWQIVGLSPLQSGKVVTATAQASGKGESTSSCNGVVVGADCASPIINTSINDKSICGGEGAAIPGALIRVYDSNMQLITATPANPIAAADGSFIWSCNGQTQNCNSGSPCMDDGRYYVTQTISGQCESPGVWLCLGTTGTTALPVINTPVSTSDTYVTGTGVADATVFLYKEDGSMLGSAVVDGSGTWSIEPSSTLTNCMGIFANQLSAANQCISANTAITYVLGGEQAAAPVIDGADCVPSASLPLTQVSGFSVEAAGAVVRVYDAADDSQIGGTTTVQADGTWTLTGVSIGDGTLIYARVTDTDNCRGESNASATVEVTTQTPLGTLEVTTDPITENVTTTISGNGTNGATVYLYIDQFDLLGTGPVSGGTWSINIDAGELYAGGYVSATQTSGTNCESTFSNEVQVQCQAPQTNFTLSAVQTGWCEQDFGQIEVSTTQTGVIYTPVYTDNTTAGFSVLGTGGPVILSTFGLEQDPTVFKVKALKFGGISCEAIGDATVSIDMFLNPANKTLSASATNLCGGQSTTITIQDYDTDATYTLQNANTGNTIPSTSNVNGSNLELTTNPLYDNVTIQVQGEKLYLSNTVTCTSIMTTTFNITISGPQTNQAVYSSDEVICHSGSTNINVDTYNDEHTYRMYRDSDDTQVGSDYTGNGNTFSVSTGTISDTETYYVTINDGGGCGEIRLPNEVTVLVSKIDYVLDSKNDVSCYGNTNGSISISIIGNVLTPTYSWSHGPTSQDVTGLAPGNYTVTITDGGFCSFQETFTINEPNQLSISAVTTTNDDGSPGGSGVIAVSISGGTSDYTVSWDGPETGSINIGSSTNYNIQNLQQGDYDVTVTDANGCTDFDESYVGDASSLIVNAMITPVSCFGGTNGEIELLIGPPGANYTVEWQSPLSSDIHITGLSAGTYIVEVTNTDNDNVDILSFNVTQPAAALDISEIQTNIDCYGNANGSIDITVTGGTAPYAYSWTGSNSFSSNNADLLNRSPGTYNLVVTDDRGCIISKQYIITQPSPISITLNTEPVRTFGGSDGEITTTVGGGTSPYSFQWGDDSPDNTKQDRTGLSSRSYSLTVTDSEGCLGTANVFISQPINQEADCDYVIGDNFSENTYSGNALSSGSLGWEDDWNRTSSIDRIQIATSTNTCFTSGNALKMGGLGSNTKFVAKIEREADLSVFKGNTTLEFEYCVSNVQNTNDKTYFYVTLTSSGADDQIESFIFDANQSSTPYSILLDANLLNADFKLEFNYTSSSNSRSNIAITNVRITNSQNIEAFADPQHVTCFDGSDGGVTLTIDPNNNSKTGISPYVYAWDDPATSTSQDLSNVAEGTYSVTITDHGGCELELENIVVTAPANPISASISITNPSCPLDTDGVITVDGATNGNSTTYQYRFTDDTDVELQDWGASNSITGLGNGTYKAYVRNSDGTCPTLIDDNIVLEGIDNIKPSIACPGTITRTVNSPGCEASVTIPSIGNAEVSDNCTPDIDLIASLEWSSSDGGSGTGQIGTRNFPLGTTTVEYTITDNEVNFNTCSFNVVVNTDVNVSTFAVTALDRCFGADGSVTIGGSLADGTYGIDYVLSGANTGSYSSTVIVAGGTGLGVVSIPSSYLANTGTTTFTITSLSRNCTVTVFTNDNDSFEVKTIPDAPTGDAEQYFCSGINPVVNNISISTQPSSIVRWYDAATGGNSVTGNTALSNGTTYYASQEVNGCESTTRLAVTTIVDESPSSAVISGTTSICNGQSTNLTVTITDGTGPFTVIYSNGASNIQVDNYNSGDNIPVSPSITTTYSLASVVDNNGCESTSVSGSATVTVNNGPSNAVISGSTTICSGTSAILNVAITGGTGPFTVVYNDGSGNNTVNNYNNGDGISVSPSTTTSYTLISVSDANNCSSPSVGGNPTVTVNNSPTNAVLSATNTAICSGNSTNLTVTITGGTSPYSVTYFNGSGNTTINNYVSGSNISVSPTSTTTYSLVSVTDNNGCAALSTSGTPTVTVNNGSTAAVISGTATICSGESTNITVSITGGSTPYSVTYSNGSSNTTVFDYISGSNISVSPVINTAYTLISVIDANGCAGTGNSGSAVITVNPIALINENPVDQSICIGENSSFTIDAENATAYQWQHSTNNGGNWDNLSNNAVYSNVNTATLNITSATSSMDGYWYRCLISSAGCDDVESGIGVLTVELCIDPPIANNDSYNVDCNTTASGLTILSNDTSDGILDPETVILDPGGSNIAVGDTYTDADGNQWTINTSGELTFVPFTGFFGVASATYTVNDALGQTSNAATITITVNSISVSISLISVDIECPELLPSQGFNPENSSYDPGATEVIFQVIRSNSDTDEWSFNYQLTGTDVSVRPDAPASPEAQNDIISITDGSDSYDLRFFIVNEPGKELYPQLEITSVTDQNNCVDPHTPKTSSLTIRAMPVVGQFD